MFYVYHFFHHHCVSLNQFIYQHGYKGFLFCSLQGQARCDAEPSFFLWISESKLFLMQSWLFLHAFSGRDEQAALSESQLFNIKPVIPVAHECGAGGSTHTLGNFYKLCVKPNRKSCVGFD